MNEVKFNKFFERIAGKIPRSFDKLSERQFRKIAIALFSAKTKDLEKKVWIFLQLLGIRWINFRLKYRVRMLDSDQLLELTRFTDFLFKEGRSEKSFIESFWFRGKKYYGPAGKFTNINFGQFVEASDLLHQWRTRNEEYYLNKFIRVLYNHKRRTLAMGAQADACAMVKEANLFRKIPADVKIAIYYNWILMMNYLSEAFSEVFVRKEGSNKAVFWVDLVSEWCQHVPENYDKKYELPLMQVLFALNKLNKAGKKCKLDNILNKTKKK